MNLLQCKRCNAETLTLTFVKTATQPSLHTMIWTVTQSLLKWKSKARLSLKKNSNFSIPSYGHYSHIFK